ncbi:MAG: tetratricopeptide repeat protein [Steroidobacteraceae bacterium]
MNSWSNQFVSLGALAMLAACHHAPVQPSRGTAPVAAASQPGGGGKSAASGSAASGSAATGNASAGNAAAAPGAAAGSGVTAGNGVTAGEPSPIPARAAQQYEQALQLMKSGRSTDAELEFKQLADGYPQFAGPRLNLGLIYMHDSRLPEAEAAFKAAVELSPNNPVAGNELGITLRKLGKFTEAESAYQRTIAADPNYAPTHLNLGVLYDLYLAEPQKALDQFERYIEIAGENKQVAGWVVELKKRVGAAPAAKKEPA